MRIFSPPLNIEILESSNDGALSAQGVKSAGVVSWVPKRWLSGLELSLDSDTDHDIKIEVGECADSSNAYILKLLSIFTKQIDNTWAVGDDAGGLFSGSVANNTKYYVHLIRKDDDGTIDAGFDTSASAANIPAGYTVRKQLGWVLTDGSANIQNVIYKLDTITTTGTWTPTLQDSSFSDSESQTYTTQLGRFIKVDKMVHINGKLRINSLGSLATGDPAWIAGLPFLWDQTNTTPGGVVVSLGSSLAISAGDSLTGDISGTAYRIRLQVWNHVNGTTALLISEYSDGGWLEFSGSYYTP